MAGCRRHVHRGGCLRLPSCRQSVGVALRAIFGLPRTEKERVTDQSSQTCKKHMRATPSIFLDWKLERSDPRIGIGNWKGLTREFLLDWKLERSDPRILVVHACVWVVRAFGILNDDEMWTIVHYIRHLPAKGSLGEPRVYNSAFSLGRHPILQEPFSSGFFPLFDESLKDGAQLGIGQSSDDHPVIDDQGRSGADAVCVLF